MNESITESQVSEIVKKVVTRIASETAAAENKSAAKEAKEEKSLGYTSTSYNGRAYFGIFSTMEEAIQAAAEAYKKNSRNVCGRQRKNYHSNPKADFRRC